MGNVCLLNPEAFLVEWKLSRVTANFPDKYGKVRNVEVNVVPSLGKFEGYKSMRPNYIERHVSNLVVIVLTKKQDLEEKIAEFSFQNDEEKDDDEDINDEQTQDVKQEDIDIKKVIQNLPTLPHFGGECKTTELVRSRSLRKTIHPARIRSNLPAKYVGNLLQAVVHFRFIIINTENHSSNQFTRKFIVDGRSIGQELERETLVFAIFE